MKETARSVSAVALCSPLDCTGQLGCYILHEKWYFCKADLSGEASGPQDFFDGEERGQSFLDARMIPVTFRSKGMASLFYFYREE